MTTIYLIRHAESEGNLFRTCQGHYEELLSQTGLQQCKALYQRFRRTRVDAVYTSDLYRAALTAQSVSRAQAPEAPLYADPGLREKGLGDLEGKSWGTVFRYHPELRGGRIETADVEGGETDRQLCARVAGSMERIARRHPGQTVAVVSHGGTISAFLRTALPDDPRLAVVCGNTSVTTLGYENGVWTLQDHNDMDHIAKAGLPSISLFREDVTDLWYKEVDFEQDEELLRRLGTDAWQTVYGNTNRFNPDIFADNARHMSKFPGCATFCMHEDEVAGLLLLDPMQDEEPGVGHISLVYLTPQYRFRGIGCQLIGRASVVYRSMGMEKLRLHVARQNKIAIRFYQKYGFRFTPMTSLSGQLVMKKSIAIPTIRFDRWQPAAQTKECEQCL